MKFLFVVHDNHEAHNSIPLGPAYVAQALRNNGVEASFFCQDVFHQTDKELEEFINVNNFDFVGIGFMAARFGRIRNTLKAIRNACTRTGALMVLGGHGPSPIPEFMVQETGADVVIIGEGEITAVEMANTVRDGRSLAEVAGICWRRRDGEVIRNKPRETFRNLDAIAMPAYDLLPMEKYWHSSAGQYADDAEQVRVGSIITGRGCVGTCSFCYRMVKGLRVRSINNIIEEIMLLHERYGINYLTIQDETLGKTKERVVDLCNAIAGLPFQLKWVSSLRVDILQDMQIAQVLAESGCVYLSLGMESLNQKVLDLMGKKTTVEQNLRAVENCVASGIDPGLNLIWGCPGDTVETLWQQVEFINKMSSGSECRTIRPVTPYPGSPLYDLAIKKGKLTGPAEFFDKFKNSDYVTVNFTDMTDEEMIAELYKANCAIIDAFCDHPKVKAGGNYFLAERNKMKQLFYDLYYNQFYQFRGVR